MKLRKKLWKRERKSIEVSLAEKKTEKNWIKSRRKTNKYDEEECLTNRNSSK
jgi:hypothetical protein